MGVRRNFITTDQACIVATDFSPLTAASNTATTFSVNVTLSAGTTGATIATVTVFWGDGTSSALTVGIAPAYTGSHTYATAIPAGKKTIKVVTVLSNGQTQTDRFGPLELTV